MAVLSLCDNNGGKENISSSSPVVAADSAFSSNKKRKSRIPLEDITNLVYPGRVSSIQEGPFVIDNSSAFLHSCLVRQLKNRYKRVKTSTLGNSSSAAATLRKHFR